MLKSRWIMVAVAILILGIFLYFSINRWDKFGNSTDQLLELKKVENEFQGDIVFVHGLMGDPIETWQHSEEAFWPDWLGEKFQDLRIWSYQYDAAATEWAGSSMPLFDRADNLLTILKNKGIGKEKPLVFVSHSLGGLVVKQLLMNAHMRQSEYEKELLSHTRSVVFLATPHRGSNKADLVKRLNSIFKAVRHSKTIDELSFQSDQLRKLDDFFSKNATKYQISTLTFFEKKPTYGALIVDDWSAKPNTNGQLDELIPVGADHLKISKPSSKNDIVFESTVRYLELFFPTESLGFPPPAAFPYIEQLDLSKISNSVFQSEYESVTLKMENRLNRDMNLMLFDCSRFIQDPTNILGAWVLIPFPKNTKKSFEHILGENTTGEVIMVAAEKNALSTASEPILAQKLVNLIDGEGRRFTLLDNGISGVEIKSLDDE